MKTTKKGFTLIELIVVIAIIGVLAAILVPTMLGYVKKSKLSSATTTASSVYKAINTALVELDEEGDPVTAGIITFTNGVASAGEDDEDSASGSALKDSNKDSFGRKMAIYFADITKVKSGKAQIEGGTCIAVACTTDETYYGTVPSGIVTTDNYTDKDKKSVDDLLKEAVKRAKNEKKSGT